MVELTLDQKKARARARARARAAQAQQSSPADDRSAFDNFARGVGSGVAGIAGILPGAAMEAGNLTGLTDFENTSGSDLIRRQGAKYGLTFEEGEDATDSIPGAIGESVGMFALPEIGISGRLANKAVGPVNKMASGVTTRGADALHAPAASAPSTSAARRILEDVGTAAAKSPKATAAMAVGGAAGAGGGRQVGEESFGEGSTGAAVSELVGGLLGGVAPVLGGKGAFVLGDKLTDVSPVIAPIKGMIKRRFAGTEGMAGGTAGRQARGRVQEVTGLKDALKSKEPGVAEAAQARLRDIQKGVAGKDSSVLPEYLSPAQRSGDKGIYSLSARSRADDPQLLAQTSAKNAENTAEIRSQIENLGSEGQIGGVTKMAEQELDESVISASANSRRLIDSFTGRGRLSQSQASEIVHGQLEDAYRNARGVESSLWKKVPEDMVMPAENVRARYGEAQGELNEVTMGDMPDAAKRFLDPNSPETWLPPAQGGADDTVSFGRLQSLRSALMDEAANLSSGSAPNRNKARIAKKLAGGLLDDMDNVSPGRSPGTDAFNAARKYSRSLNDRFTRGPVGEVLKLSPNRDFSVPKEQTLARTLGKGKEGGARANKGFKAALGSDNPTVRSAITDYMDDEFSNMAIRTGPDGNSTVTPNGAEGFRRKYGEVLADNPMLAARYSKMAKTGRLSAAATRAEDGAASVLSAGNPAAEVRKVQAQTKGMGREGQAVWERFRRNMLEEITQSASRTRDGETSFSGQQILDKLDNQPKFSKAMEATFSKTQLLRLRQLAKTQARIEQESAAVPASNLTDAAPNWLQKAFAQYTGARVGTAINRAVGGEGGGMSLQSAQMGSGLFSKMMQGAVKDPQVKLIRAAMESDDMLKALLVPPQNQQQNRRFGSILNAWSAHVTDQQDINAAGAEMQKSVQDYIDDATDGKGAGVHKDQWMKAMRTKKDDREPLTIDIRGNR